jgi:transcription initiation factor TFIIIB Brf1 subunit/transcription initiation factor TFIIB
MLLLGVNVVSKCENCGVELTKKDVEKGFVLCVDCGEKLYNSLPD